MIHRYITYLAAGLLVLSLLPLYSYNYDAAIVTPRDADDFIVVDVTGTNEVYTGTQIGFPHVYQLPVEATTTLAITLKEPAVEGAARHTSLIVVKEDRKSVLEVARVSLSPAGWVREHDWVSMSAFYSAGTRTVTLSPGVYRVEASSPTNTGSYHLTFGEFSVPGTSLWAVVKKAYQMRVYYGMPTYPVLVSPVVMMYLAIILWLCRRLPRYIIWIWQK